MDARSKEVGDLRCPERGFSAPSNQTAPSDQAADAPGDAFRALPANDAVANAACRPDAVALVEHGMCGGFSQVPVILTAVRITGTNLANAP